MDDKQNKISISVCLMTYNEEANIRRALKSVAWADEIVVIDSFSTDKTRDIAESMGAKVHTNSFDGHIAQRNNARELARGEWIFYIDGDEQATEELGEEIRRVIKEDNGKFDAYDMPRKAFYLGRWINHCGWYPNRKIRLYRRSKAHHGGTDPHDKVVFDDPSSRTGHLKYDILHYTYRDFAHQLSTINKFSDIQAKRLYESGKRYHLWQLILFPKWKFFEVFFLKLGFLDGFAGIVISVASAFNVFSRYVKLREIQKANTGAGKK